MKKWSLIFFLLLPGELNAQIITTVAGNGATGFSGDNGPAIVAKIGLTHLIAFDKYGNYYFNDFNTCRIRKVSSTGVITTVVGTAGILGYGGDGGPATAAKLKYPEGVTCDTFGNLYIADHQNYRIRKVDAATGIISTFAGTGAVGDSGDGGPATAAMIFPDDLQFDILGNLYVTTGTSNKIRKISPSGIITTIAGIGTQASSGDGGPATAAEIFNPVDLTIDDTGNVYFAELRNIRKINTSGIINTIAGTGIGTYNGDGMTALSTQMAPLDIFFNAGVIYFSDTNQRVRVIDGAGIVHTIAGTGAKGYNGDGMPASSAQLNTPGGISIDACGNLYFVDVFNYRIRKINYNPNCWPARVENNISIQTIKIYPNPANDILCLDNISTEADYRLLSIVGALLQKGSLKQGNNSIPIQSLPAGVYVLEVISNERERVVRRVVKE